MIVPRLAAELACDANSFHREDVHSQLKVWSRAEQCTANLGLISRGVRPYTDQSTISRSFRGLAVGPLGVLKTIHSRNCDQHQHASWMEIPMNSKVRKVELQLLHIAQFMMLHADYVDSS